MTSQTDDFAVLITAQQAWPEMERAVLAARSRITASFRIFNFATRLRSPEALDIGKTWADLILHVLARGVSFRLVLSDFDRIVGRPLHEMTQKSLKQAAGMREILSHDARERFEVISSLHPAQAGTIPRLALLPFLLRKARHGAQRLNPARLTRPAVGVDPREVPDIHTVTHHQKIAVIDGEILFIGGLDLNERRFDTPSHDQPSRQTWMDVQIMMRGAAATEAARHIDGFLDQITGEVVPPESKLIRRTLSAPRKFGFWALSPQTVLREIEEDYIHAFETAHQFLYLETQYFRSTILARALARAARRNPDLRVILVLPALPDDVAFGRSFDLDAKYGMALQSDCTNRIIDAFGERLCIASPVQKRLAAREAASVLAGSPIIYVHSKVLIKDDSMALVGSANMNGRSMRWDTEAALRLDEKTQVSQLWHAINEHWWTAPPSEARAVGTAAEWWCREVARNTVRQPESRSGFLVSHDPYNMSDHNQPLPGVTENVV
ncbi:phospholipase D family protein [Roseobacter fucihabitans]|nr:phospholipase D-like domain-containing protein [Roseobacter litoralis]